jgi:membrane associated rhomboid family serine protease
MITFLLIALTGVTSYVGFNNQTFFNKYLYRPYAIKQNKEVWRFVTSAFLHADWMHFIFNMLSLFFFAPIVEAEIGILGFLTLYISGCVMSLVPNFLKNKRFSGYTAIGASGAVSSVVFAAIMIAPFSKMSLLFLPIPMSSWLFGLIYLFISWYMYKRDTDNVGHDVHIYGALWGLLFMILVDYHYIINLITNFI